MNEQDLKTIAQQLNVDFLVLQKIFSKFRPKDKKELIKVTNDITGLQNQLNTQDIDGVINFYSSRQQPQNEPVEPVTTPQIQTPTRIETPVQQPVAQSITPQQVVPQQTLAQPIQPQVAQRQPQAASINFEDKYGQGFQFRPTKDNPLLGQCAAFAEQITRLPDGSNWTIGNTIQQKKNQLQGHKQRGNGFLKGEEAPQVGNSVVLDTGTQYGHVAVVSEVLPDGRLRLTESNWDNDQRVRHDRIIDPNDQSVVGFVRSKPTAEFRIEQPKTPPTVPSTPDTQQEEIDAPQGKQELPIKKQVEEEIKTVEPELAREPRQEVKPVVQQAVQQVQTKQPEPEKNVGFLDVFSKNAQAINNIPEVKPEIVKPTIPEPVKPVFKPEIKQPEPFKNNIATQSASIQKPVVEPVKPMARQPEVPKPQIIKPPVRVPMPPINQFNNVINKVAGFFRR